MRFPWRLSSRVHSLNHFPTSTCYVKRDDELSCGISGSKLRKYASLIPYLQQNRFEHLIIIAGPQSNNLLAALQIAREYGFSVSAFLLKPKSNTIQGNFKLSLLFLKEEEITWVEREQWAEVETLAQAHASTLSKPTFVINEGASVPESMPGALTLGQDILENEQFLGFSFDHIFVDAGTGFSAAALIKGLHEAQHQSLIRVLLLADTEAIFTQKMQQWLGCQPTNYQCFYPQNAKAFGSVNTSVIDSIKRMAIEEGILVDPIYSAKLFHESRRVIEKEQLSGRILIIHSGGALTLSGFPLKF